jgi:hypothetical protein
MKLWRGQPDNWRFKPTARELAHAWTGIGAMFVVLAFYEFRFPRSHNERWSWLHDMAIAAFGPRGSVVLYSIIGAAFIVFGIHKCRSSRGPDVA